MSHLSLGLKTPRTRLVELVRKYRAEIEETTDMFVHAELVSYLDTIFYFCIRRGGWQYWESVNNEASESDDPFGYAPPVESSSSHNDFDREAMILYARH